MDERNDGEKTRMERVDVACVSRYIFLWARNEPEQKGPLDSTALFLLYKPLFTPQNRCFIEDFT